MLYLIESGNYYKIGFSKDVEVRMKLYSTHNPEFKLVDTCEGTKKEESLLHLLCLKYLYLTEWFNKDPEILTIWNLYKQMYNLLIITNKNLQEENSELKIKIKNSENLAKLCLYELELYKNIAKRAINLAEKYATEYNMHLDQENELLKNQLAKEQAKNNKEQPQITVD